MLKQGMRGGKHTWCPTFALLLKPLAKPRGKEVWVTRQEGCLCECLVTQLCPTLSNPWNVAHQAPLSMGFSRQEYWSGLPRPPPSNRRDSGSEPLSPALQADSLPSEPPGKPSEAVQDACNLLAMLSFRQIAGLEEAFLHPGL